MAPEAFSEHPNWPANYGAWYVSKVLDALTSDPDVWAKTALFLTYDENDGFFDHWSRRTRTSVASTARSTVSLTHELYTGRDGTHGPYGLGIRVPMTVISPWSTGGWVCSEIFDHTSIIRFMEQRFGVHEPNITPWRRAVCGDLTSAFDFSMTPGAAPTLPNTDAFAPPDNAASPLRRPRARRRSSACRSRSRASGPRAPSATTSTSTSTCPRRGWTSRSPTAAGSGHSSRRGRTTWRARRSATPSGAGRTLTPTLKAHGRYDVSFHGPNGFFRRFAGRHDRAAARRARRRSATGTWSCACATTSDQTLHVQVADAYGRDRTVKVRPKTVRTVRIPLAATHGLVRRDASRVAGHPHVKRALAGRFENGRDGTSDPQLGR